MLSSSSMGVGFDDSIRRRALSKLPHLHRDFRVELNGVVLSLCVFVVLGVEVAVMFVLTVMLVGREMAGSMMETETVRKERNHSDFKVSLETPMKKLSLWERSEKLKLV